MRVLFNSTIGGVKERGEEDYLLQMGSIGKMAMMMLKKKRLIHKKIKKDKESKKKKSKKEEEEDSLIKIGFYSFGKIESFFPY